jgi:hypothetical protein
MRSSSDFSPILLVNRSRFFLSVPSLVLAIAGSVVLPVAAAEQMYPDVVGVKVKARSSNVFDFDVTVSSPYDSAQRYAVAFRVMSKDGAVFGERKLLHDHESEQPFTRDLYGVAVPAGIHMVVIQAKDQKYGYGGKAVEVDLPGR